jgi:hypothetical protein
LNANIETWLNGSDAYLYRHSHEIFCRWRVTQVAARRDIRRTVDADDPVVVITVYGIDVQRPCDPAGVRQLDGNEVRRKTIDRAQDLRHVAAQRVHAAKKQDVEAFQVPDDQRAFLHGRIDGLFEEKAILRLHHVLPGLADDRSPGQA